MNTVFISFFQPDTYVYNAGEELENIFNRLLKISFPNFEDVFLEDSVEEEKDQQQETPYLANCQYGRVVFLGELVFKMHETVDKMTFAISSRIHVVVSILYFPFLFIIKIHGYKEYIYCSTGRTFCHEVHQLVCCCVAQVYFQLFLLLIVPPIFLVKMM